MIDGNCLTCGHKRCVCSDWSRTSDNTRPTEEVLRESNLALTARVEELEKLIEMIQDEHSEGDDW